MFSINSDDNVDEDWGITEDFLTGGIAMPTASPIIRSNREPITNGVLTWVDYTKEQKKFADSDEEQEYTDLVDDLSPQEAIANETDALLDGDMETCEFLAVEDPNDNTMYDRAKDKIVTGYTPKVFKNNWKDVKTAVELIENVVEESKMGGKITYMFLDFKDIPVDRIMREYGNAVSYLVQNSMKICAAISYLTGILVLRQLEAMAAAKVDKSGKYFKIVIHIRSVFRKDEDIDGTRVTDYKTFSQEEELHRYATNGVPWGIATPSMAYKIAFNATQRALWKTKTSSSGWTFAAIKSATIQVYQVQGFHAKGKGKRRCKFIDDEAEGSDDDEEEEDDSVLRKMPKKKRGIAAESSIEKGTRADGLLKSIASANAVISPQVRKNCFIYSLKIGLICRFLEPNPKNLQRAKTVDNKYQELLEIDENKALIIPPNFPEAVPLDESFFAWFCELNPLLFLHVWIQIESEHVPLVLFYRTPPSLNKVPIHILYVGGTTPEAMGHYVCIKNINKLFYRSEKCNKKTKYYCPWCCTYNVRSICPKHPMNVPIEDAIYCGKCMTFFETKEELEFHENKCLITDKNIRTVLLPEKHQAVGFPDTHFLHLYKIPVVFVSDFESILAPVEDDEERHKEGSKLYKEEVHTPCSFGITVLAQEGVPQTPYFCYTGKNADDVMDKFCETIIKMSQMYFEFYKSTEKYHNSLTAEAESIMLSAESCHICKTFAIGTFEKKLFPDFDQFTHKFLGAACKRCIDQKKSENFFIPLVFHNARGYDLHHIVKYITRSKYGCKYNGIPQNGQKLMSMTISREVELEEEEYNQYGALISKTRIVKTMCDIRIIDSLLFLLKSLEKLVDILKDRHPGEWEKAFPRTYNAFMVEGDPNVNFNDRNGMLSFKFTKEQVDLVMQKNIYPYKWFDSFEKFNEPFTSILDLVNNNKYEAFTDNPEDEGFLRGWEKKKAAFNKVVQAFPQLQTVTDYANIYLACDVCQLADIIENTRNLFMSTHKLDPMYYFGAPGYSWDAFLYDLTMTRPQMCPQLFGKGEMNKVCFFMQGIRGGCSGIMKRYATANNKHMGDLYDPTKPSSYIIYLDANNLYGWSMQQELPYCNFAWVCEAQIEYINRLDIYFPKTKMMMYLEQLEQDEMAGFFEVKLEYHPKCHDRDNLYPLAPEKSVVQFDDVTHLTRELNTIAGYKLTSKTPMLLQTLRDKDHYFVHSKLLKFYMQHGLEFRKIYSGLTFKQAPLMRPYIDKNTELRNKGTSVFEKELYKLLNNSIYGKTFENPMKYSYLKFVNGEKEYNKVVSMTGFKGAVFAQDDFMIAKVLYEKIKYNKPLYLGATVTEYAKFLMFQFYYDVLKDFYGDNGLDKPEGYEPRVQLLFTDTDSLMLQIFTDDIFEDIKKINSEENMEKYNCPFDISSFDKEVIEQYGINHPFDKVIGKFKSETGSKIIYRFVGLRSKMYAYQTIDEYREQMESEKADCHKRGKGIPGAALNTLTMKSYLKCLFGTSDETIIREIEEGKRLPNFEDPTMIRQEITTRGIRSFDHKIYSTMAKKYGLSCNDTKRFILADNIHTLAYGHYKIKDMLRTEITEGETDSENEVDLFESELEKRENQLFNK